MERIAEIHQQELAVEIVEHQDSSPGYELQSGDGQQRTEAETR